MTVQPEKMQTVMQTLLPYLNQPRNYFNQQPAYVLHEDGSQAKQWRRNSAKGIEVEARRNCHSVYGLSRGAFALLVFRQRKTFPLILVSGKNIPSAGA